MLCRKEQRISVTDSVKILIPYLHLDHHKSDPVTPGLTLFYIPERIDRF